MRTVKNGEKQFGGKNQELSFVQDICGKFRYGYLDGSLEIRGRIKTKDINLVVKNQRWYLRQHGERRGPGWAPECSRGGGEQSGLRRNSEVKRKPG